MNKHLLLAVVLAALPAAAQSAYKAPRTWGDKPDLQGIWQAQNTASYDLEAHTASTGVPAGPGVVIDPADGKIPYLPAALEKKKQNFQNHATADPVGKCFMPGVPRFTYMPFPIQIFQTPKFAIITSEYIHNDRTIYLDGSKHLEGVDFYDGDSRGHWEGDTLVVDTIGMNERTWLDTAGHEHSDQLHLTERFQKTDANNIKWTATFEDPKFFTEPFSITLPVKHQDTVIMSYSCEENEKDRDHLNKAKQLGAGQ
jgi:hypothetical protein